MDEKTRCENAFGIFLALIAAGNTESNSYRVLAESAFVAVDVFQEVKEEQTKNGV